MREQKNLYEMTDRELRAYKRELRRQRQQRRRIVSLLLAVCLIAICVISFHSLTLSAKNGTETLSLKYYTGVTVKSGESLWTLADQYIDYEQYSNKDAYIKEVCSINRLDDASAIRAGQRLIFPYYSDEFIR
ncbi:MAG: LysM peptidoglycan-binding domain-containing protein [Acetatifactor sp.]|nr:LysM peptidoglycan-binding domain-containing protein [Acetatifactor sp.]